MHKRIRILLLGFIGVISLFLVYLNHFDNPFELDDSHTIVTNQAIREFTPAKYFSDAQTYSSLPANQAYRPGITLLNAIDYAIWSDTPGEAPQPMWFHVSIFITFVLLCIVVYFVFRKILDLTFHCGGWNPYFALFGAALFAFHTANAETVNYIIARSDLYSTFGAVCGFLIYMYFPKLRKFHLFLFPVLLGFLVKEAAIMFAPLLFLYVFLFEEHGSLTLREIFSVKFRKPFIWSIASLMLGAILFMYAKHKTPSTWSSGAEHISPLDYFITNFYSVFHYISNFLVPANLSVDTDITMFENKFDTRIIAGGIVIALLLYLAVRWSKKKESRPAAFGILWFFITLIPTSTFFPFAEALNDHRTFFGYIGLVLAAVNQLAILCCRWQDLPSRITFNDQKINIGLAVVSVSLIAAAFYFTRQQLNTGELRFFVYVFAGLFLIIGVFAMLQKKNVTKEDLITSFPLRVIGVFMLSACVLIAHAFGAKQRNQVWGSQEALWKDASEKCPNSGRIWMNYGLTLMAKGSYNDAFTCFEKAREKAPYYSNVYINLGILKNVMGRAAEAETDFKTGIQYGGNVPDAYKFYGDYLLQHGRVLEADSVASIGLQKSPYNAGLLLLKSAIEKVKSTASAPVTVAAMLEKIKASPTEDNWLNLSLAFYNAGDYRACVDAASQAIKINPNNDRAYNNICAAYNMLKEWNSAVIAGKKGLEINPNNQLLANNLNVSLQNAGLKNQK